MSAPDAPSPGLWARGEALTRHLPALLPQRIPLRQRVFFRGAFLLLALAPLGLTLTVLIEEKDQALRAREQGFARTLGQLSARLRHPTGQLALLNPDLGPVDGVGQRPVVLPFSAIDFDDRAKVQQAVEMAGCGLRFRLNESAGLDAHLCVAVGSNPLAGGFIYAVGSLPTAELTPRRLGERDFSHAHRVRVTLQMRGQTWRWMAPYELTTDGLTQRGRLTGFVEGPQGQTAERPVRDFRGWLWRDVRCLVTPTEPSNADGSDCLRQTFFSLRLPVELFREDLHLRRSSIVWPPPDLAQMRVRVQVFAPGDTDQPALFDSGTGEADAPFALNDLSSLLQTGETLHIGRTNGPTLLSLNGPAPPAQPAAWLVALIQRLPSATADAPLQATDTIHTSLGQFDLTLQADPHAVDRQLAAVAARLAGFVGAMLLAVALAWLALELRLIRRITLLTQRAAGVAPNMRAGQALALDLRDLQGPDELGLLAHTLDTLMQRVQEDVHKEHLRAQQEKDQWHAVGHEIMSPLQSLMVLHPQADDPSHRYIQRMQQAVRVLYGQASPSEAFARTPLPLQGLDLVSFVREVLDNAEAAGWHGVVLGAPLPETPCPVQADAFALEDVLTHILNNAQRWRTPGTPITLHLRVLDDAVVLDVHNQGPAIPEAMLEQIFEYGVSLSGPAESPDPSPSHRGQGLFVARTYVAKMGASVQAVNRDGGVALVIRWPRRPGG